MRRRQLLLTAGAVDRALDVAQDTDRRRTDRRFRQPRQRSGVARIGAVGVMDDDRLLTHLRYLGHGKAAVGLADPAALALRPEADRLAALEMDLVRPPLLAAHRIEGAVVEDVAVLVDLDEGRPLVLGRRL